MAKIAMLEGYGAPSFGKRRKHKKSAKRGSQRSRMRKAAKICKGRKAGAFRACMRKHLKRGRK